MNVHDLRRMKQEGSRISMITCYDYWSARILNESKIDCLLVGDSLAMVMHGHANTIPATTELIALHVRAVSRGATSKLIVADMPFLSVRSGLAIAMTAVDQLIKAGAHAVKIEGLEGHEDIVRHIVQSGVPVMGHLGLVPQSVHQLGGYRVQGRKEKEAEALREQAQRVQECGCFALVLECIASPVAREISGKLKIPTIGIGAGSGTDGQVLVFHDMLDLFRQVEPKFVRKYASGHDLIIESINRFDEDVKSGSFPSESESYS